ncbi:MAG: hypothetical protein HUU27_04585, partial [Phycisphaerae bacterium]|nr:hypothetical protein [Phycisphaerae bacterium]
DAELQRPVNAATTPGRTLAVRMGESLLQLCGHGTHHRAQALNMLRHLGGRTPGLDLVTWLREAGGRAEPGCLQPGTGRGRDQVLE